MFNVHSQIGVIIAILYHWMYGFKPGCPNIVLNILLVKSWSWWEQFSTVYLCHHILRLYNCIHSCQDFASVKYAAKKSVSLVLFISDPFVICKNNFTELNQGYVQEAINKEYVIYKTHFLECGGHHYNSFLLFKIQEDRLIKPVKAR